MVGTDRGILVQYFISMWHCSRLETKKWFTTSLVNSSDVPNEVEKAAAVGPTHYTCIQKKFIALSRKTSMCLCEAPPKSTLHISADPKDSGTVSLEHKGTEAQAQKEFEPDRVHPQAHKKNEREYTHTLLSVPQQYKYSYFMYYTRWRLTVKEGKIKRSASLLELPRR